eukprot:TRINITY_DN790_c0_g1_i3.p1 TRINITY_DN790_c0_g1~~TRINITY_DN790_c0_g1_i3.p1  ORF type:complete len:840 (+),score=162.66 TRINITY_DN790_c0_g1_i3:259-2778(+)
MIQQAEPETQRQELFEACKVGDLDTVKEFISQDPQYINVSSNLDEDHRNPLLFAAGEGHIHIIEWLLNNGADPAATASEFRTNLLTEAVKHNQIEVVKYVLEEQKFHNFNVDETTSSIKWSALHYACNFGNFEILQYLISKGASIDLQTNQGRSPLHLAFNHPNLIDLLLENGANVNQIDSRGQSTLHRCAIIGDIMSTEKLLEAGADVNLLDINGDTPLDIADRMNMWEVALRLWKVGKSVRSKRRTDVAYNWTRPRLVSEGCIYDESKIITPRYNAKVVVRGDFLYVFGGQGLANLSNLCDSKPKTYDTHFLRDCWCIDTEIIHEMIVPIHEKSFEHQNIKWDPERVGSDLILYEDSLSVEYSEYPDTKVGCVLADSPFNSERDSFGYFEVEVITSGDKGYIGVGFVQKNHGLEKQPGWLNETYGYHGDDGKIYHSRGTGVQWGPRYGAGDVVGCGINFKSRELFYTLNGEFLGIAYKACPETELYPSVGCHSVGEIVRANFGSKPFKFTFEVPMMQCIPIKYSHPDNRGLLSIRDIYTWNDAMVCVTNRSEVYIHEICDNMVNWKEIPSTGQRTILSDKFQGFVIENKIYILTSFGGFIGILYYHLVNHHWERVNFLDHIPFIENQNSIAVGNKIYVWGGKPKDRDIEMPLNICWIFDIETELWSQQKMVGEIPTEILPSSCNVDNEILIFGGFKEKCGQQNQIHVYDCNTKTWYKPHISGTIPRARNNHSMAYIESTQTLITVAGWNGVNYIDDVDVLSLVIKQPKCDYFFDCQDYSDISFDIEGNKIYGHRVILISRSQYFKNLLEGPNADEITTMPITDAPYFMFYSIVLNFN